MSKRFSSLDLTAAAAAVAAAATPKRRPPNLPDLLDSLDHAQHMLKRAATRITRANTIARKWRERVKRLQRRIDAAKVKP
jgi:chromatin segregation and condensation protein Rec8/ScpA/Scc1 (kleisin family)